MTDQIKVSFADRMDLGGCIALDHPHKQSVGRAMLRYLENVLCEQGHTALYSSSQANEPEPQAWHRYVGFKECGFIAGINGAGIGEIFFLKDLSRHQALSDIDIIFEATLS
jgi:hypothetical protein